MEFPICAMSFGDMWSFRWHPSLKPTWLNLSFNTTRIITECALSRQLPMRMKYAKRLAIMTAALLIFIYSGLLHEYLTYVNIGMTDYTKLYLVQEMWSFTIHGLAIMMEKLIARVCKGQQTWLSGS